MIGVFDAVTDSQIYAVPMGQAIVPVYYNTQMFKDNTVEVPTTWEEFMNAVKTFKGHAGWFRSPWPARMLGYPDSCCLNYPAEPVGKELFDDIVTGKTTWDDPRYVETGELLQEMVTAGAFEASWDLPMMKEEACSQARKRLCTQHGNLGYVGGDRGYGRHGSYRGIPASGKEPGIRRRTYRVCGEAIRGQRKCETKKRQWRS